jgi:Flp pilus assembly protein TadG
VTGPEAGWRGRVARSRPRRPVVAAWLTARWQSRRRWESVDRWEPALRRWSARTAAARERGSATVELAVALPVIVLLLLAGLSAVDAVATKMRCVDAAREAARAEARGEPGTAAGQRAAPGGASVQVGGSTDTVTATVAATVRPFGRGLPGVTVTATAVAAREPEQP